MSQERITPERRSTRRTRTGDTVTDRQFLIRCLMLADHATTPPDGKLYIAGGGIDRVMVANPDTPSPPIFIVGRIAIPYTMMSEPHAVTVSLLDDDRQPVLPPPMPNPLFQFTGETGRPPGTRPGDDLCIQFCF